MDTLDGDIPFPHIPFEINWNPTLEAIHALLIYNSLLINRYATINRIQHLSENDILNALRHYMAGGASRTIPDSLGKDIAGKLRHMDFDDPVKRPLLLLLYPDNDDYLD